jgi:hypothetical protein
MPKHRLLWIAIACTLLAVAGTATLLREPGAAPTCVGTPACAICHQEAYANWQQSQHRHAMEVASAQSVLGGG